MAPAELLNTCIRAFVLLVLCSSAALCGLSWLLALLARPWPQPDARVRCCYSWRSGVAVQRRASTVLVCWDDGSASSWCDTHQLEPDTSPIRRARPVAVYPQDTQ